MQIATFDLRPHTLNFLQHLVSMQYYGLTQALSQAGYYETGHRQQLIKDIKGAVMQGRLIAVCGVVGSGKTVTLRRLLQILKEENRVSFAKSISVGKHSIKLATLISALYYDLLRFPRQTGHRFQPKLDTRSSANRHGLQR